MITNYTKIKKMKKEFYEELEYHRQKLNKLIESNIDSLTDEKIVTESKILDEFIQKYINENRFSIDRNDAVILIKD